INQTAGLKTLGAGLRHIRNENGLTLIEVSEHADMTLSVYHRIEMGQREVSDKEFKNIAHAMSMTIDGLKARIKELEESGDLTDIIEHNDNRYRVLNNSRYANLGAMMLGERDSVMVPVYGSSNAEGNIIIDRGDALKEVACPIQLQTKHDIYAINLCTRRLGSLISSRAVLFADPTEVVSAGDIALYYIKEDEAKLLSIREDENGRLYGLRWNPDERVALDNSDLAKIHKIVVINL
ncbi:MAG: helix-turn-helix transcriptional regulator, partial [Alphaproteobacteria bacterium]|nr:helix-turn-helix transcriptional regulator [Alphaproteobacteria bacterium]